MQRTKHATLTKQDVSAIGGEPLRISENGKRFVEVFAPNKDVGEAGKNIQVSKRPCQPRASTSSGAACRRCSTMLIAAGRSLFCTQVRTRGCQSSAKARGA